MKQLAEVVFVVIVSGLWVLALWAISAQKPCPQSQFQDADPACEWAHAAAEKNYAALESKP